MNTRLILAILAAFLFYFFGGWLIYGILLADTMAAGTTHYEGLMKAEPDLLFLSISNLAWATLVMMVAYHSGGKGFLGGAVTGLWVGLLLQAIFDCSFAAFYNLMDGKTLLMDFAVGIVFTGIGGAIGGLVLGDNTK